MHVNENGSVHSGMAWYGLVRFGFIGLMVREKFARGTCLFTGGYEPRPWGQFFYNKYPPPGTFYVSSHAAHANFALQEYCTESIFIVIGISFLAIFHLCSNWCPQRIIWSEPILPLNIHFVFHIVLFYLWYQTSLKKAQENVLPRHHLTSSQCFDWLKMFFCFPPRDRVAKGQVYWNHGY